MSVLCHCEGDMDGHEPGTGGCVSTVKAGNYFRPQVGGSGGRASTVGATGTCPKCQRPDVKVRRAKIVFAGHPDLMLPVGAVVAIRPAIGAHRTPGRGGEVCEGRDELPAETRWRSAMLDAMVRDFGADSVVIR